MFNNSSEIPSCLGLNIVPSCQALSKTLDISQGTLLTSSPTWKDE